ncbi:MAG: hypothetical protein J3K34DRAFT_103460 [Monoraphidium minutum]|nr:MAG: hypothetical protein J3K34DRAFT_103460 [Monoraphidium minutum]
MRWAAGLVQIYRSAPSSTCPSPSKSTFRDSFLTGARALAPPHPLPHPRVLGALRTPISPAVGGVSCSLGSLRCSSVGSCRRRCRAAFERASAHAAAGFTSLAPPPPACPSWGRPGRPRAPPWRPPAAPRARSCLYRVSRRCRGAPPKIP